MSNAEAEQTSAVTKDTWPATIVWLLSGPILVVVLAMLSGDFARLAEPAGGACSLLLLVGWGAQRLFRRGHRIAMLVLVLVIGLPAFTRFLIALLSH